MVWRAADGIDRPDTWGEIALGAAVTVTAAQVVAAIGCGAFALGAWSLTGRRPPTRRLALLSSAAAAAVAVVLAAMIVPRLDEGRSRPDCDTFALAPGEWRELGRSDRLQAAYGLDECGALQGKTMAEVRTLLGPARNRQNLRERTWWGYAHLSVGFRGGTVADVSAMPPYSG